MNKRILSVILSAMIAIPGLAFAEENINLLKNSDLKLDEKGQLPNWETWAKCKFTQDAGDKGKNSVRMTLEAGADPDANSRIVLYQTVNNLKPGKYIFSANIKMDRRIVAFTLFKITKVKGETLYDGKDVAIEPEEWNSASRELNIPEGITSASFAFSFIDAPGARVWVDSPALYKVKE